MVSVIPLDADSSETGHIEKAGFINDVPVFAGAEGILHLLGERHVHVNVHDGLLAAEISLDGKTLVTTGEGGSVVRTQSTGAFEVIFQEKGKWIDRLAVGPSGAAAFAWGKQGAVLTGKGEEKPLECERTIEGMAFQPKGMRLALARYNGVELKWINTNTQPQFLEWKGAHSGVVFSPDGKYVVSQMQENALHGWRLSDGKHMRMTGYPAKVKSLSWSARGKWLASSGAPAAIVWPFSGKDGPMGKAPKELGAMSNIMVTQVCCHPAEDVIAIGYEDGMVAAVRIDDGKEAVLRRGGNGAISSLGWDINGKRLAYGSETGEAGLIDLAG